ncbi:MAG: outer membrane beta-barrel protein [Spartobacteria bacterium]
MKKALLFFAIFALAPLVFAGQEQISKEVRQELPPNPFSWEGAYIGLNAGGAFGFSEANDTREYTNFTDVRDEHADSWTYDASGFTGGIQWGYNWQRGHLVYGLETDVGYLNIDGDGFHKGDDIAVVSSTQSDFYWSTRGRLGWAFGRLLLYGTGGSITVNYDASIRNPANGDHGSHEELRPGWTGGGGIEYAFNDRWSLKAEYLYFELENGTIDINSTRTVGGDGGVFQFDHQSHGHIARLGINYHFGACAPQPEPTSGYDKSGKSVVQPVALEPAFTWTGPYVGLNFGWGKGRLAWYDEPNETNEAIVDHHQSGIFGGAQLGINTQLWQWLVIGTEAKFSGTDIGQETNTGHREAHNAETNIEWMASTALRVGVACPHFLDGRFLVYGKGGMSDAHINYRADRDTGGIARHFETDESRFAPLFGGGIEYAFSRHWTARVEYDFADYGWKIIRGNRSQDFRSVGGRLSVDSEQYQTRARLHSVEAGVSYKF